MKLKIQLEIQIGYNIDIFYGRSLSSDQSLKLWQED